MTENEIQILCTLSPEARQCLRDSTLGQGMSVNPRTIDSAEPIVAAHACKDGYVLCPTSDASIMSAIAQHAWKTLLYKDPTVSLKLSGSSWVAEIKSGRDDVESLYSKRATPKEALLYLMGQIRSDRKK